MRREAGAFLKETDKKVAQVGEISGVPVIPFGRVDRAPEDHDPIPVLKWLGGIAATAFLATLGGFLWFLQGMLANESAWGAAILLGDMRPGAFRVLAGPILCTTVTLCLCASWGIGVVRAWKAGVLGKAREARTALEDRLQELESRLGRATAATDFWKEQSSQFEEKASAADAARLELEARIGRLADREKQLAKEQEQLSRAKDRLEKHVEARTIELHRLQRRYESILNCAGEGICSSDLEGRIRFANPAAVSMMGWSREDLLEMQESEVFADHGRKPAAEDAEVEPGQAAHPAPVIFQRKDGTQFSVELIRTPVEENGRQVGTVLVFKDVTERTEADERFAAKVAELARSNAELEQFAFVASHDLQEPLRKIQAFGDRLTSRLEDNASPEALDYLGRMQNASARMQRLIDGLLMYSRVITRAQPFSQVDLNAVVREVAEDLEVRIEKSGAEVRVEDLPTIEADGLQMRQLFQNLIGNALKFQAPGSTPRVRVFARPFVRGTAFSETDGGTEFLSKTEMVELTVEDNGVGFDESYLKRLFVVFQRLHSRSEYEGTGIGLAVCRKIANRHGGFITAKSTPGEGSRFVVLLPLRHGTEKGGIA